MMLGGLCGLVSRGRGGGFARLSGPGYLSITKALCRIVKVGIRRNQALGWVCSAGEVILLLQVHKCTIISLMQLGFFVGEDHDEFFPDAVTFSVYAYVTVL